MADYVCNVCDRRFETPEEAVDHVSDEHDFFELAVSRVRGSA